MLLNQKINQLKSTAHQRRKTDAQKKLNIFNRGKSWVKILIFSYLLHEN
jgi:hypothetical protein